ncbi:MAG: hypothetical protein ABFD54_11405 [Armatimonadota bacterium]
MSLFTYPTTREMRVINDRLQPQLTANDPIFQHFPVVDVESFDISWFQRDDYFGMQQLRGLDGQPGVVSHRGAKEYSYQPGVYGEVYPISEKEITRMAELGQISSRPMSLDKQVMEGNTFLAHREMVLIKYILWTLVTSGTFSIAKDTAVVHADRFPIQTATAAVDWDNSATATPIADFRAVQLLGPEQGVSFGAGAKAYMNRVTFNKMLANTNTNDLGGKLARILQTVDNAGTADLALINRVLAGADLPQIEIQESGYRPSRDAALIPYIANDKVSIIGQRQDGEPLGEYRRTINANNDPVGPGSYAKVWDSMVNDGGRPPRKVEVHRGHNGGPVIYYPGAVVVLSV